MPIAECDNGRIVSGSYELCRFKVYGIVLEALTSMSEISNEVMNQINKVLRLTVDYQRKSQTETFDTVIIPILFTFIKKNKIKNDSIVFFFVSAAFAAGTERFSSALRKVIVKEDVRTYVDYIHKRKFLREKLYEELVEHGI